MNEMLTLRGDAVLIEASAENADKTPRFEMVAYTGGPMLLHGFDFPLVIDLEGLDISRQKIPIRLDHDSEQRIGHTTEIKVEDGKLIARGLISHENSYARTVAISGKNGFPWQSSVGARMTKRLDVPAGGSTDVNGQRLNGPLIVAQLSELREISFVDYGADEHTSVQVSAKRKEENNMDDEKKLEEKETKCQPSETKEVKAQAPETRESNSTVMEAKETRDPIAELRASYGAEMSRIQDIRNRAKDGCEKLTAQAISEGWEPDRFELEMLRGQRPEAPAIHSHSNDVNRSVIEAVGIRSFGGISSQRIEKMFDDKTLSAADRYHGCGIRDFAELACGRSLPNPRFGVGEWMEAAFDASGLSGILSNTANKVLLEGYNAVENNWREFCKVGATTDFKTHTRYRMLSSFKFQKVGRGGELKHGEISEMNFTQKIDTHGIMFALTRQMIIDDDLGALYDIPYQIGIGAGEAISDAVWEIILTNPTQSDSYAFFSTQHDSLLANNALSITGLTAAETAFGKKTQPNGRPLGIRPEILLVPLELKSKAETLMTSEETHETTSVGSPVTNYNPHKGKYKIVVSPFLSSTWYDEDGSDRSLGSTTAWYLIANPNRIPALEVAFLGGVDRPTVQRADADFNTLGVQFRGFIDFGVKEQDYRGILKVAGA